MKIINKVNRILKKGKIKNDVENIINTINMEKFRAYEEKYKDASPFPGYSKYLEIRKWLPVKLAEYYRLKLDKKPKLDILDIGTGAGYFPYVCNYFGHNCIALDMDSVPMYNDLMKLLKIERIAHEVKPYEKLPDFGKKFDLITAYSICFNNHDRPHLWTEKEWRFFLQDLANNYTKENCEVLLVLNPEKNNKFYDDALLNFFTKHGAEIDTARVYFNNIKSFR